MMPAVEIRASNLKEWLRDLEQIDQELHTAVRVAMFTGADIVAEDARDYFEAHLHGQATDYIRASMSPKGVVSYVESGAPTKHVHGQFGAWIMSIMKKARKLKEEQVFEVMDAAVTQVVRKWSL